MNSGRAFWELTGTVFGKRERLIEKASPYLRDLNNTTGLLVSLRVLENELAAFLSCGVEELKAIFII